MSRGVLARIAAGGLIIAASSAHADVSVTGDYSTDVTIDVPNLRDLAPSVALRYSSASNSGIAGVGWRLDAGSAIHRTGPRGALPGTSPAAGDEFLFEGEPLVPCRSTGSLSPGCISAERTWGTADDFFSTKRESNLRFEYHGGTGSWTVNAPNGFKSQYDTFDGGKV